MKTTRGLGEACRTKSREKGENVVVEEGIGTQEEGKEENRRNECFSKLNPGRPSKPPSWLNRRQGKTSKVR